MDIQLDSRNKPAEEFFIFLKIQDGRLRPKVLNRPNFISARHLDLDHPIRTIFGMDILLDPKNKPVEEFFIFLKIQDGRRRSNVQNRPNFTPQITFRLIIWIRFIRFGLNLAGRYYSTQGTSLRKNF